MTNTLGDALPREQARVRELVAEYRTIGAAGAFAVIMLSEILQEAEEAVMSGDPVAMIHVYQRLKECQ